MLECGFGIPSYRRLALIFSYAVDSGFCISNEIVVLLGPEFVQEIYIFTRSICIIDKFVMIIIIIIIIIILIIHAFVAPISIMCREKKIKHYVESEVI